MNFTTPADLARQILERELRQAESRLHTYELNLQRITDEMQAALKRRHSASDTVVALREALNQVKG